MDLYDLYKEKLNNLEIDFDSNKVQTLKKMIELYIELEETNFHDLADSIEMWVYEEGNEEILKHLVSLNNNVTDRLLIILKDKIGI